MTTPATHPLPPLRLLAVGLHALVAGLLVLAMVRSEGPWAWAAGLLLAVVYAAGSRREVVSSSQRRLAWSCALFACWVVVLVASADGIWLAFPLFFVFLHLLPRVPGRLAVAATTVGAIAAYGIHDGLTPASVIGPLIGGGVAVGTVAGYEALVRESEERQQLLDEVNATRESLAAREREAGAHAERERMAREIHDTLAQGLTSIQLLLRAAERDVTTDPGAAAVRIATARQSAQDNLEEARRFVRALPPPGLEGGSLADAIRAIGSSAHRDGSGQVELVVTVAGDEHELPSEVATALLRIAQSAIGNAVEHSRASRVSVTLTYMGDEVVLDVVDDGRGFRPAVSGATAAGTSGRGYGLSVMRARAQAAGGRLAVESAPGAGTAVAATFPVEGP